MFEQNDVGHIRNWTRWRDWYDVEWIFSGCEWGGLRPDRLLVDPRHWRRSQGWAGKRSHFRALRTAPSPLVGGASLSKSDGQSSSERR